MSISPIHQIHNHYYNSLHMLHWALFLKIVNNTYTDIIDLDQHTVKCLGQIQEAYCMTCQVKA